MYVGRIVAIGRTRAGSGAALYRVSSRSFPNREAKLLPGAVAIVPKPGFENDIFKNPYIAYNCVRLVPAYDLAVATNGSHTDPLAEKLETGMTPRDALVNVLAAMDYEHDHLKTPRIAAVVRADGAAGWLGIVRHDAILVREFTLQPGQAFYLCTYEKNAPCVKQCDPEFDAATAADACARIMGQGVFAELEKPVSAVCAVADAARVFAIATL
jgi:IMP cyclohydrolase